MNGQIVVYFQEGQAFVEVGNNYFLCIGTLEEVASASPADVARMVNEAIALNRYMGIDTAKGVIKH